MMTREQLKDAVVRGWDWVLWHGLPGYWYHKLPDLCRQPGCNRRGVRGNENIVDGQIMCDYCSAKRLRS